MSTTLNITYDFPLTKFNTFIYPAITTLHKEIFTNNKQLKQRLEMQKSLIPSHQTHLFHESEDIKSRSVEDNIVTLTYDIVNRNMEKANFKQNILNLQFGKPELLNHLYDQYKQVKIAYNYSKQNVNNYKLNIDLIDTNIRVKTPRSSVKGEKLHLCGNCLEDKKLYFVIKGSDGSNWAYHSNKHAMHGVVDLGGFF